MKENLFTIPKTITAGYQNRKDTYSGRLAYIIYTDDKGVLRKEKSWSSWRDKDIPTTVDNNEPHSGFFLNKHVGGYVDHWLRQSYIRVYDRTFDLEFEITLSNLNYILSTCSWNPAKGLEGDFVYAWYGTDLWLLPTHSSAYKESMEFIKQKDSAKKFTEKDLVVGHAYRFKNDVVLVYLGKMSRFCTYSSATYVDIYDSPIFTTNDYSFAYFVTKSAKDIVECTGTYTITNSKVLKCMKSEFNYTGIAYMHSTPTLIKKHLTDGVYTFYREGIPYKIEECDGKYLAKCVYQSRLLSSLGKLSLQALANRLYVQAEFKDGKLVKIL